MAIVFREGDPMDTGVTAEAAAQSVSTIGNPVQRNKHMLFNERLSDVFFSVGAAETAKKIPAHTFLLSQASDVFQTMFSENWKNDKPVQVVDFEAPTFCTLLRWIYCEELIFPPGMLVDVMKIAHKYMVHSLISLVTTTFSKVDKKYVWSFHTMAIELEMADLTEKSFNRIKSDQATHLAYADFLNASCASVTAFVSLDRTAVTDLQIFTRCLEWSEKECERRGLEVLPANQRMVMEKFMYQISFESMTAADFAGLPCESGVLTGEEQAAILRIAAGNNVEHGFKKKAQRQGINCRNWKAGEDYHFYCPYCIRYVCRDCFAAGIRNATSGACSTCRSRGYDRSYATTLLKVSHDKCAGSP